MANITLYPPVIESMMPAFVFDNNHTNTRVYFSISDYNTLDSMARVKVGSIVKDSSISEADLPTLPAAIQNNMNESFDLIVHKLYHEVGAEQQWTRIEIQEGPIRPGSCPDAYFNISDNQYNYWNYLIHQGDKGLQILTELIGSSDRITADMLNQVKDPIDNKWYCYTSIADIKTYINNLNKVNNVTYIYNNFSQPRIIAFNDNSNIDGYIYPWVIVSCINPEVGGSLWNEISFYTDDNIDSNYRFFKMYRDNYKYLIGEKNCYYIEITNNDITYYNNRNFQIQIRFLSADYNKNDTTNWPLENASWMSSNDNIKFFSEWSSVCLLKRINQPLITFDNPDIHYDIEGLNIDFAGKTIASQFIDIDFNIDLNTKNENDEIEYDETLQAYRIRLYEISENFFENPLEDSGWINLKSNINNIINKINYKFKKLYEKNVVYHLYIDIRTIDDYENSLFSYTIIDEEGIENKIDTTKVDIKIANYNIFSADIQVDNIPNHESGEVLIRVWNKNGNFNGNLLILRTSSTSDFKEWDVIFTLNNLKDVNCVYWVDRTTQSDEWYLYSTIYKNNFIYQSTDEIGEKHLIERVVETNLIAAAAPVSLFLDDSFLIGDYKSLKVKFDPSINSFKWKVTENSVETLGSRYPFFNRNGNINYRTFPISGTIATWMDDEQNFINREDLFNDKAYHYHMDFVRENHIDAHQDWILEKKFRDAITSFLMSNKPKLFKSLTEGNILVKIHDVNFTPNKILGRMIWSFSATATEIGEVNLENIHKYNIQELTGTFTFNDIGNIVYDPEYALDEDLSVLSNGFYIMQEPEIKQYTIALIGKEDMNKYNIRFSRYANEGSTTGMVTMIDEFGKPIGGGT